MSAKKLSIQLEHRVFGFGTVKYRKATDYGSALIVKFPDKLRTILLEFDGYEPWVNREDALAAFDNAPEQPRPKGPPRKPRRVRRHDVEELYEPRLAELHSPSTW